MANKKKINKNNKKESKEDFEQRICENMGNGFVWNSANWSILKLTQEIDKGNLIDPEYQRKIVWDTPKSKSLIETILEYGGNKIPTLTLRNLENNSFEIVDGKQRLLASIKPFVEGKFSLNGVYVPELRGYTIKDIKAKYPQIYSAFMNTTIPVQIAYDMSEEEAKTYFIQINESGVNMRVGEKIHANQGTPLIKTIEEIRKHEVWDCVKQIGRYNDYAYISRMLLYVRDYDTNPNVLKIYNNTQLMKELTPYLSFNIPQKIIKGVVNELDVLHNAIYRNTRKLTITDTFSMFLYIHSHQNSVYPVKFGQFIEEFYELLSSNKGVFRMFNQQKKVGRTNNTEYQQWFIATLDYLYTAYLKGYDWNEISKLQVKQ